MPLACLICIAMFGSGAKIIGIVIMKVPLRMVALGWRQILEKTHMYYGAAPGTAIQGIVALPTVTATVSKTTMLVFG